MIQVVAVVGPTGSGKTSLGIELAQALETEIISADSMQFYRGMEIGTGAPSKEQLARAKHHFISCMNPGEEISAGQYQERARKVVADLNQRGKIAVVVGGSGLYIRALLEGLFQGPSADPEIRQRLEAEANEIGQEAFHNRLKQVDPATAAQTEPADVKKVVRALEVYELSGRPISELHHESPAQNGPLQSLQFAMDWPRETLYERINQRVDEMMKAGFLDEVKALLDAGHRPALQKLRALGYREMMSHLAGDLPLDEATAQMKMQTRRYAKRQLTWFRSVSALEWLPADKSGTDESPAEQALSKVRESTRQAT